MFLEKKFAVLDKKGTLDRVQGLAGRDYILILENTDKF